MSSVLVLAYAFSKRMQFDSNDIIEKYRLIFSIGSIRSAGSCTRARLNFRNYVCTVACAHSDQLKTTFQEFHKKGKILGGINNLTS